MDTSAKDIADQFTQAISFPDVVLQLDGMLNDGVSNTSDFARLISQDPGLTATLLKFANSAMYGFSGEVATVDRAISLVGMREIRDLVFSVVMKETFDEIPNDVVTVADFWRHSLLCGLASQQIAEVLHYRQREVLFTAGLLHDIGHLAMFSQIPDACTEVLLEDAHTDAGVFQLERDLIGFDHQEVGAEIARNWHFPAILQDTIAFNHVPDEASEHQFESCIVHAGNTIAVMVEMEIDEFSEAPPISASALVSIGLDEARILRMLPDVQAMFVDMRTLFGIAA